MHIAESTVKQISLVHPNIPPSKVTANTVREYWERRAYERESQLSAANAQILRMREDYSHLDEKYQNLLRRAREAHRNCPDIPRKPSLWKRFLRNMLTR